MSKLIFAGTPYAWVPIGSVQYIDQATLAEFRDFYHEYYVPENATYVLAGDFDPEDGEGVTSRRISGRSRPAKHPFPGLKSPSPPQTQPKTVNVDKQNTPLPATLHAWLAPKENDPDADAVDLLTNILATGRSSRLYRRLVDKEQAAVEAQAFPFLLENAGMVGVFAVGNRGVTLERLDTLINEEVAKIKKDGVTEEEYQKSLNSKQSEIASSYGTMLARAQALGDFYVFYHDTNKINSELDDYLKVTREDIKRVANKIFHHRRAGHLALPRAGPARRTCWQADRQPLIPTDEPSSTRRLVRVLGAIRFPVRSSAARPA